MATLDDSSSRGRCQVHLTDEAAGLAAWTTSDCSIPHQTSRHEIPTVCCENYVALKFIKSAVDSVGHGVRRHCLTSLLHQWIQTKDMGNPVLHEGR